MVAKKATQSEENINEDSIMTAKNMTTKKNTKERREYITIQQSGEELSTEIVGPSLTARQKKLQDHAVKNR